MKVDELIKNYNIADDKDKFLSELIITQYVPYHEKMIDCGYIISATTKYENQFKINSPMRFVLFINILLSRYTEIGEDENILTVFEKLDEVGLIDQIISKIPEREYNSYNTILNMELDDYMENNRSIVSIVEGLKSSFDAAINTINNVPRDVHEVAETEE